MTLRINPCRPYWVTTPFGVPGDWAAGFHTGDDYSTHGRIGVPIYSTWPGRVWAVGHPWGEDYGTTVVIEGWARRIRTGYCHLNASLVKPGDWVRMGGLVGLSGSTGRSTGPHLHYEERRPPFGYGDCRVPRRNYKGSNHGAGTS